MYADDARQVNEPAVWRGIAADTAAFGADFAGPETGLYCLED